MVGERWLFRVQGATALTILPSALVNALTMALSIGLSAEPDFDNKLAEQCIKQRGVGHNITTLESDCLGLNPDTSA